MKQIMMAVLVTATLYQEITKEALVYIISLFVTTPLTCHVIVFILHTMNQMCVIFIRKDMKHIDILLILYKKKYFEDTIGETVNRTDNTMAKKGTKHKTKIILHREMQHIPQYFIRRKV